MRRKLALTTMEFTLTEARKRLQDFLEWWGEGLLLLLPARWLARLRHQPDTVTVEQQDGLLIFRHYTGAGRQLSSERTVSMDDESEKAPVKEWLNEQAKPLDLILLLPRESRLQKQLTYPLAAEKELRSVLEFDMDKQTPFTSDRVYFDYIITGRDTANDQLHITLCLVMRDVLHKHLDAIGFLDQRPETATTDMDDSPEYVNFMPPPDGNANKSSGQAFAYTCLAAFLLFIMTLYLPLLRYDSVIRQFEERIEQARSGAMHVQVLENKRRTVLKRSEFLSSEAQRKIPPLHIIGDLTRRLPDNTWINRLSIRADEIQLHGESEAAAAVVQLMEESDYFEQTQFRSPVTKNNSNGKDQFHIAAKLRLESGQ